jgi:hypothetical protein
MEQRLRRTLGVVADRAKGGLAGLTRVSAPLLGESSVGVAAARLIKEDLGTRA